MRTLLILAVLLTPGCASARAAEPRWVVDFPENDGATDADLLACARTGTSLRCFSYGPFTRAMLADLRKRAEAAAKAEAADPNNI